VLDSSRMSAFKLDVGVLLVKRENEPTMKTLEDLLLVCSQKKTSKEMKKKIQFSLVFYYKKRNDEETKTNEKYKV
jgi:hypothetical protein